MELKYLYWTKSKGIGGSVKKPEDFVVNEILDRKFLRSFERTGTGVRKVEGPYTLFLLTKRQVTTKNALKSVAKELGISRKEIGYAGLKDKFAVTKQYITVKNAKKYSAETDAIRLEKIGNTNRHISIGNLGGNEFVITLHECKAQDAEAMKNIKKELAQGLPNYFGPQRFGSHRNNHLIGRMLVKRGFDSALREINGMSGKKYAHIMHVDKMLLKFFINAYQSWLFNETLNKYAKTRKKPLFGKIPIVGFDTKIRADAAGNMVKQIMKKEKTKPDDFRVNELRIACRGSERDAFIKVNVEIEQANSNIKLKFRLPKGSYATNVMREICKNDR